MTIMRIIPLEGSEYHPLQSQSHRESCWEDGFIAVPEHLVERAYVCNGQCKLVIEEGVLLDILPLAPTTQVEAIPSAEQDRDSMLVDLTFRMTLLELGVK